MLGERQLVSTQGAHAGNVDGQIKDHHTGDTEHQAARQRALRLTDFRCHKGCRVPAAVGEKDLHQRGAKGNHDRPAQYDGLGTNRTRIRYGLPALHKRQAADDQHEDCQDLEDHENVLGRTGGAYARAVDECQAADGHGGNDGAGAWRLREIDERMSDEMKTMLTGQKRSPGKTDEFQKVMTESDRDRRHASRLYDPEQRPAIGKADHGVIGFAQERVLATHLRAPAG